MTDEEKALRELLAAFKENRSMSVAVEIAKDPVVSANILHQLTWIAYAYIMTASTRYPLERRPRVREQITDAVVNFNASKVGDTRLLTELEGDFDE